MFWSCLAVFLGFGALSASLPWLEPRGPNDVWVAPAMCAFWGSLAVATIRVLRIMPETIHVDDRGITHEARDGWLTTLAWDEVAAVRERPFHQRLELHGGDGRTVIRLENQLDGFERLLAIVLERTGRAARGAGPVPAPDLPATFRKRLYFAFLGVWVALGLGMAIGSLLAGVWPLGLAWLALVVLPVADDWYAVRVEPLALVLLRPFRARRIEAEEIEEVRLGLSQVVVVLRNGKTLRLAGVRDGSLALHAALGAMLGERQSREAFAP